MPKYSDPTLPIASASAIKPQHVSIGQFLVLVAGILSLLFAGYMYWQVQSVTTKAHNVQVSANAVSAQNAALQSSLNSLQTYNAVGTGIQTLFSHQVLWSPTMANLEQHLYKHMAVSTLQIDNTGKVTLTGTTPSYTDYAAIYSSLTDASVSAYFSNVRPAAVATDSNGLVDFTFTFTFSPRYLVNASAS